MTSLLGGLDHDDHRVIVPLGLFESAKYARQNKLTCYLGLFNSIDLSAPTKHGMFAFISKHVSVEVSEHVFKNKSYQLWNVTVDIADHVTQYVE